MTTRAVSITKNGDGSLIMARWVGLRNGDDGEALHFGEWGDRSVQVVGTFGAGGSLRWEGSNDEANYCALTDAQGVALNITVHCVKAITEIARASRPRVTAGDADTNLDVHVLIRRPVAPGRVTNDRNFRGI